MGAWNCRVKQGWLLGITEREENIVLMKADHEKGLSSLRKGSEALHVEC